MEIQQYSDLEGSARTTAEVSGAVVWMVLACLALTLAVGFRQTRAKRSRRDAATQTIIGTLDGHSGCALHSVGQRFAVRTLLMSCNHGFLSEALCLTGHVGRKATVRKDILVTLLIDSGRLVETETVVEKLAAAQQSGWHSPSDILICD